ncbi:MAG: VWA domain-containing protein [Deltaproteobacteria bacterium]|nr:VWA domain-containing protein [Deltaproteobacteria bacterium]
MSFRMCSRVVLSSLFVLPCACLDHPLKSVEYESIGEGETVLVLDVQRKVDVLFVIDNSGSMGEEQAVLAANFNTFVEVLERMDVGADYRIGITTTDNGNISCRNTTPEAGALQMRSCRSHLDDFVFSPGTSAVIDKTVEACLDPCPDTLMDLQPVPTALDDDGAQAVRPWLQRGNGTTNVPEGVTTAQALGCWGPQGINGCGFESALESMRLTLVRSGVDTESGYGFMRDDALLQVVFITDEADCSVTVAGQAAFDIEGTRDLWPDPEAPLPPSAVCWNAGVGCSSLADGTTHCEPVVLDASGEPVHGDDAALHPLRRYIEILRKIDEDKRLIAETTDPQVLVSVIGGVPSGYAGEPIDYAAGSDGEFFDSFGVGPGCSSGNGTAVPPVRLRVLAEAFADEPGTNLFSICDADYSPALDAIAEILVGRFRPNCIEGCVAAVGALDDGDLPSCTVVHEIGGTSKEIATCVRDSQGQWQRPEGEALCLYAVTGDDLDPACDVAGQNVELRFLRDPQVPVGNVSATCEMSTQGLTECPGPSS